MPIALPKVKSMTKLIQVRKLAAVDMVSLGTRVIVVEYALGVALPLILGIASLRARLGPALSPGQVGLGVWLVTIALNYVPLLLYAVSMARSGTVRSEGEPELAHVRRYAIQQAIILVPLFVVILALVQERMRRHMGEVR